MNLVAELLPSTLFQEISVTDALFWIRVLAAIAIGLQSVELIAARRYFGPHGIWRAHTLRPEIGLLATSQNLFISMLMLRLGSAVMLPFVAISSAYLMLVIVLLLSSLAISMRWRGLLNGGSDYMTIIVLSGLLISALFPPSASAQKLAVIYIAAQSVLSYCVAGVAKLCSVNWRSGAALHAFATSGIYPQPAPLSAALRRKAFALPMAWGIILFEALFPLALFSREAAIVLLPLGACFHLANSFSLGLSRFFWIWIATYPAIFALSL